MSGLLSVVIPASNEARYIGPCLAALFASQTVPGGAEAIVVANGCTDDTADRARATYPLAEKAGWNLTVLELARGGKPLALNAGDAAAQGEMRAYLDADVCISPGLMAQLVAALTVATPRYASGRATIPLAQSRVTRAYARFWLQLPFARSAAPGFGLFAVNTAARARWGAFPGIISDDTFVRLHFAPQERISCPAPYNWPMIEGFNALVKVRRRQDQGVAEIARLYPELLQNEGKAPLSLQQLTKLALADIGGFAAYAAVSLAVRMRRGSGNWTRGR
jgi:glycosyltransferase involved in cell wall biosynthesis